MILHRLALVVLVVLLQGSPEQVEAASTIDPWTFASPEEEARYRRLIEEFRCPKCLNTNIAGSDSPIAADLRREVKRMVDEGMGDEEIRDWLQARYGDFVLYRPPFNARTWMIWVLPALLALGGLVLLALALRSARAVEEAPLDAAEAERLRALTEGPAQRS